MRLPLAIMTVAGKAFVFVGAGLALIGALGPWVRIMIFKNIEIALPGFCFITGGLCLAIAALVLLRAHRSPLLCLIGGLLISGLVISAHRSIPHQVKRQMIGAQMALFPINRLLNQFHISDIDVGGYGEQDGVLDAGLTWSGWGGGVLLIGGLLGLPGDPIVVWTVRRTSKRKCSSCGARWLTAREASYCPACGARAPGARRRCRSCHSEALPGDRHCVCCGDPLPD